MALAAAEGADATHCTLAELLELRTRSGAIDLVASAARSRTDPGAAPSRLRGRGIEFEEVRAYAPGDDVRAIDWRVTARTGKPHTRLFRAERERPVYLLLDQRAPMYFGSRVRLKSQQALRAATLLAWAALAGGDRVGGLVLEDATHHERRPRRSRHAVLELLRLGLAANARLARPQAAGTPLPFATALTALRRVARPGSLAILVGDFHDWSEDAARQLHLLARHVEVHGLRIEDPLERALPGAGGARVTDGARELEIALGSRAARERYGQRAQALSARLHEDFGRCGSPLRTLDAGADTAEALARWYRAGKAR